MFMRIILTIWQLPQEIIGALWCLLFTNHRAILRQNGAVFFASPKVKGAFTMGSFVFLSPKYITNEPTYDHEFGHVLQSRAWGWLWLLVFAIPSGLHCLFHNHGSYYHFYTERDANRRGGVPNYTGGGRHDEPGLIATKLADLMAWKAKYFGLLLLFLLASCCRMPSASLPEPSEDRADSTHTEYKETIRYVRVEVPVPGEVREIITPDTTSHLRTSVAYSWAGIRNGMLWHKLQNRQDSLPKADIQVIDTSEKEARIVTITKREPYAVLTPLTRWQKFRMDVGGWALLLILLFLAKKIIKIW